MKHTEVRLIEVTQDLGLCTFTKLTSDSDTKQFENHCAMIHVSFAFFLFFRLSQ